METPDKSPKIRTHGRLINPDLAVGPQIAVALEQTQINHFHTKGGTGFAAEDANAFADAMAGHAVEYSGRDCSLNGADRIVDGIKIQTKYYESATQTMRAAFDSEGVYRYAGQRLEVPADQYEACLAKMRAKIADGKVPGISNPADAESIVQKGRVTYRQARNIARAGTIDGLKYDAKTHAVGAGLACGISFAINFAQLKWHGVNTGEALKDAALNGLGTGTMAFVSGIATSQVLRTRAAAIGRVMARDGMRSLHGTRAGKMVIEKIAAGSLGRALHGGAAINYVAKLARSNVVTSVVVTAVMSTPDLYRATVSKGISWKQFSKNLAVNASGVAGGAGGWFAGVAVGAAAGSAVPILGTAVGGIAGGIIGSLTGGALAGFGSKKALDKFIDDDGKALLPLINEQLFELAWDYMLSQKEYEVFVDLAGEKLTPAFLRDLHASTDRPALLQATFEPPCQNLVSGRDIVYLPDASALDVAVAEALDEVLKSAETEGGSDGEAPASEDLMVS